MPAHACSGGAAERPRVGVACARADCSEALAFVSHLPHDRLQIVQHGDMVKDVFWQGLPAETRQMLATLNADRTPKWPMHESMVVCHSTPGMRALPPLPCGCRG